MKQYDPKQVTVEWNNLSLSEGIAAGTFILATRTSRDWTMEVGSDGEVTRVAANDNTGSITLTLKQGSAQNAALTAILAGDRFLGTALGTMTIKDSRGISQCIAINAFIEGPPDFERSDTESTNDWVFLCERLEIVHAGNEQIDAASA